MLHKNVMKILVKAESISMCNWELNLYLKVFLYLQVKAASKCNWDVFYGTVFK